LFYCLLLPWSRKPSLTFAGLLAERINQEISRVTVTAIWYCTNKRLCRPLATGSFFGGILTVVQVTPLPSRRSDSIMPHMTHQPIFDIPNFERVTSDKLADYYILAQRIMYEMQRRHTHTTLTPFYENAEREWKADPINNPTTLPQNRVLTVEVVNKFYQRCDAICDQRIP
jgi:hypothetical protein